jgi:type II secretory pathway component PulF
LTFCVYGGRIRRIEERQGGTLMEAMINVRKVGSADGVLDGIRPVYELYVTKTELHANRNNEKLPEKEREEVTSTLYMLTAVALDGEKLLLESEDSSKVQAAYNKIIDAIERGDKIYTIREGEQTE